MGGQSIGLDRRACWLLVVMADWGSALLVFRVHSFGFRRFAWERLGFASFRADRVHKGECEHFGNFYAAHSCKTFPEHSK